MEGQLYIPLLGVSSVLVWVSPLFSSAVHSWLGGISSEEKWEIRRRKKSGEPAHHQEVSNFVICTWSHQWGPASSPLLSQHTACSPSCTSPSALPPPHPPPGLNLPVMRCLDAHWSLPPFRPQVTWFTAHPMKTSSGTSGPPKLRQ